LCDVCVQRYTTIVVDQLIVSSYPFHEQALEVRKRSNENMANFTLDGATVKLYMHETDEIGLTEMNHIANFYIGEGIIFVFLFVCV